jgi:phosphoglucosamine mutase
MKYFGTDGIRGKFGTSPIDGKFFRRLAKVVERFAIGKYDRKNIFICVGRDTRKSGVALQKALICGFSSAVKIFDCGILPTPAIAETTRYVQADIGIVITASHNPACDNGIKLFNAKGEKLTIAEEGELEQMLEDTIDTVSQEPQVIDFHSKAKQNYCDQYKNFLPNEALSKMVIALDSANGSTYEVARKIFEHFGAQVIQIGNHPNGENINDNCGTEHPETLATLMKQTQTFLGIAHDGDGDRVIIFDETGEKIDGDVLLGIITGHLLKTNGLPNKSMVTTVQSNLGLDKYLQSMGIDVIRCDVGDRNVYQAMVRNNCYFGGENSGHLIFRKISPIGDGITAALFILDITRNNIRPSKLKTKVALFPQKSFNILVNAKTPLSDIQNLNEDIEKIDSKLPSPHRILVRYSGTEPKLRVLVEAPDQEVVNDAWRDLKQSIIERMTDNGISASIL